MKIYFASVFYMCTTTKLINIMETKKNIVEFRRRTRGKSPSEKFRIFSEIRMPKVLNAMKSVSNLANKRYYKYTEEEKRQILRDLKSASRDMIRAWEDAGKPKKIKKKSYWDRNNGND